jgi:hypothetical protein
MSSARSGSRPATNRGDFSKTATTTPKTSLWPFMKYSYTATTAFKLVVMANYMPENCVALRSAPSQIFAMFSPHGTKGVFILQAREERAKCLSKFG